MRLNNSTLWLIPIILDINKTEFLDWIVKELLLEWTNWEIIAEIKNPEFFNFN